MSRNSADFLKGLGIFLFVVSLWLGLKSEWEYDEAWTYFGTMNTSLLDILRYSQFKYANNHVFNSAYYHLLQFLQIKNVFLYRAISYLSLLVYVYYLRKIFFFYRDKYELGPAALTSSIFIVLFLFLPYSIYFFMARGYAFAVALFTAALYYFICFLQKRSIHALASFLLFGSLSSLSIFSFVFVFIAMAGVLGCDVIFVRGPGIRLRKWTLSGVQGSYISKTLLLLTAAFAVIAIRYIFLMGKRVSAYDPFIIGGNNIFVNGMASSIISFMCLQDILPKAFSVIKLVFVISAVPAWMVFIMRKKIYAETVVILFVFILLFCAHILLGAKYPLGRGMSFMYLLLYIPMFISAGKKRNLFYMIHFSVILLIGLLNLSVAIDKALQPNRQDALAYIQDHAGGRLLTDKFNPNILLMNRLYFSDSVRIETSSDLSEFNRKIDTSSADFVLATRDSSYAWSIRKNYHSVMTLGSGYLLKK